MPSLTDDILNNRVQEVIARVKAGESLSERDEYGYLPLLNAAIINNDKIVDFLLSRFPDIDAESPTGETALFFAIDNGNETMARKLLAAKANPNHYDATSTPILITPLVRHQTNLVALLHEFGAKQIFADDYINTKLIGHQFELKGWSDIVDVKGAFIEVNLEGFLLEFSLSRISESISECMRDLKTLPNAFMPLEPIVKAVAHSVRIAGEMRQFKYKIHNYKNLVRWEKEMMDNELKLIPISFDGHAITLVIFHHYLILCDRGVGDANKDKITVYRMQKPEALTKEIYDKLLYTLFPRRFVEKDLLRLLGCTKEFTLPIRQQITGNCSWANVEAGVLAMLFCLTKDFEVSRSFYEYWLEWAKDKSIDMCLKDFDAAPLNRKASKAALLSNVFVQSTHIQNPRDVERAKKIARILQSPHFKYILRTYIKVFVNDDVKRHKKDFYTLLKLCKIDIKSFQ